MRERAHFIQRMPRWAVLAGALIGIAVIVVVSALVFAKLDEGNQTRSRVRGDGNVSAQTKVKLEQLRKAADKGNAEAEDALGTIYFDGEVVPKDYPKAAEWYEKAASHGHANERWNRGEIQWMTGYMYEIGSSAPKDAAKAIEWYQKSAAKGKTHAMTNLAFLYAYGEGVPKDLAKAVEWYRKAAEAGDTSAQKDLAERYAGGDGVPKNEREAARWYEKAAEGGDAEAQEKIGKLYFDGTGVSKDEREAAKWFQKADAQGNKRVQFYLGLIYEYGKGVPKDPAKAIEWYRKAADYGDSVAAESLAKLSKSSHVPTVQEELQEDAETQFRLGKKYQFGLAGASKDIPRAVALYQSAAAKGHAECQVHLCRMYIFAGQGVVTDRLRAFELARSAALQGHAGGQFQLGTMYSNGWGVTTDKTAAVEWWEKAAAQGYSAAQFSLGIVYSEGLGVNKDSSKAVKWLKKAAENEFPDAKETLQHLYAKGDFIAEDVEKGAVTRVPNVSPIGIPREPEDAMLRHLATDDRLVSGSLLVDRLRQYSGKGKLTLDNGLAADAYVKLVLNGKLVAAFYVRSQEKFTCSTIPDGSYSVLYCTGYGWDASVRTFARGKHARRYDTPLTYAARRVSDTTGVTTFTDVVTLTLHKVIAGNAKASDTSLEEFDRY